MVFRRPLLPLGWHLDAVAFALESEYHLDISQTKLLFGDDYIIRTEEVVCLKGIRDPGIRRLEILTGSLAL
jgi:hypothetical protein